MSAPQAQSKLSEVLAFLRQHEGIIDPDRIAVQRWIIDAKSLRAKAPVEGFMMEAWGYRAQGKLDKALDCMKKAYRLDSSARSVNVNYASLLLSSGRFRESEELCMKQIKLKRVNVDILKILISNTSHTFNKNILLEAIDLFIPTNLESENVIKEAKKRVSEFDHMISTLESADLSIETFERFSSITQKIRNSHYIGESRTSIKSQINELGKFLLVDESLSNASIEDCLNMNDELIEKIIDDDFFEEYKKIIFNFTPSKNTSISSTHLLEV